MEQDTDALIDDVCRGRSGALDTLLERHRTRLTRMVAARMDHRVTGRFDPSDVIQETLIDASRRLRDFAGDRPVPFYVWLRQIAVDRLQDFYRRHLRAKSRSVLSETPGREEGTPLLATVLIDSGTSPSQGFSRRELRAKVEEALRSLKDDDRDILLMRYLEQMSVSEIAAVHGLHVNAAKSRLRRALERLHQQLQSLRPDYDP